MRPFFPNNGAAKSTSRSLALHRGFPPHDQRGIQLMPGPSTAMTERIRDGLAG